MNKLLKQLLLVCVCLFALTGQAIADSLSDADGAYDAGDYAQAGKLFRPLAEQGNAQAQENIQSTVCVKGYTKTVRPPAYYTNKLKKRQMREYGCTDMNPTYYEDDHLITLSIGGAPDDPHNLWPESRNSEWNADKKDQLEFVIYRMVCAQEIHACGSTAHDVDKLALGVHEVCSWKSLSSWSWLWSCSLK